MNKWIVLVALTVLLAACSGKDKVGVENEGISGGNGAVNEEKPENDTNIEPEKNKVEAGNLSDFFMEDGAVAQFTGDGIEFSSYRTRTEWLDDTHVNVYEDNGGIEMIKSYRLDEDKIVVLQERPSEKEGDKVALEDLANKELEKTYLSFPLEVGTEIDVWKVISVDDVVETPLQKFTDVLVLEEKFDDDSYNRSYFARGYGEIMREYHSEEDDAPFKVTSILESVE